MLYVYEKKCYSSNLLFVLYYTILASVMRESADDAVKRFEYKTVLTDHDIDILKTKGIVVIDNVLNKEQLILVRQEINAILDKKRTFFVDDGFKINEQEDLDIRKDLVMWISEIVADEQKTDIIGNGLMRTLRQIRSIPVQNNSIYFFTYIRT